MLYFVIAGLFLLMIRLVLKGRLIQSKSNFSHSLKSVSDSIMDEDKFSTYFLVAVLLIAYLLRYQHYVHS
jgi:hypothetical protein